MDSNIVLSRQDQFISSLEHGLRTCFGHSIAGRPKPSPPLSNEPALDSAERKLAGALMRVNHVGEVCAQALYQSQALVCRDIGLRQHFIEAAKEEQDHLAWTQARLQELSDHRSYLTPVWYSGAFAIGSLAGLAGDRISLGFVVETERQVEQHLASHLNRLPAKDNSSRAIVEQMKADEARHADAAQAAGASPLPGPIKLLMRWSARVMTFTAHYI
jgi:ubiquinone biosynthesis monooxygenase Coq7